MRWSVLIIPDILQSVRVNKCPTAHRHAVKVSGGRIIYSLSNSTCSISASRVISDSYGMSLRFTHGWSPVYSCLSLFSHAALFFSARSMALTSLICCWLVNLSSLFSLFLPSALFFWLGLLSGVSWGNAWSLPVCLCLLSMLFFLCVCVHCLPTYPSLQQPSSLS